MISTLATLTVPETVTVPRRRMGLNDLLTRRLCPESTLPVVPISEICPVRSMFDYDPETASEVAELPHAFG